MAGSPFAFRMVAVFAMLFSRSERAPKVAAADRLKKASQ
jgi:hypothetical protein